jgi:hypothetical protein
MLKHPLADRKDDLYETPPEATRALLKVETFGLIIWEPAHGRGAITYCLRQAGYGVYATDLKDYGPLRADTVGVDFLMESRQPVNTTAIVTNPPFKLADEFARHALALCPKVAMLLRLAFLEGEGRSDILDGGRLRRVHVFRNRLPMMHRDGWTGPRATSSTAFAWFVWEAEAGPTVVDRITWE